MDGEHRSLCYRGLFEKGVILFGVTTDGDRKRKIRQDNRYPLSIGYELLLRYSENGDKYKGDACRFYICGLYHQVNGCC